MVFKTPIMKMTKLVSDVITFRDCKTTTTTDTYQSTQISDKVTIYQVYHLLPRVDTEAEFRLVLKAVHKEGIFQILPRPEDRDKWYSPLFYSTGNLLWEDTLDIQTSLIEGCHFELVVDNTLSSACFVVQIRFYRHPA